MSIAPGTRLGPYEIVSPLGAGGMGEVYRARDTRLGRDVAVKVLPETFAKDSDRLRRFEQEARTIAALNHPNILAIHDTGTYDGRPYLVSEMLEGQTLREALEGKALPIKRVIEYAQGIAKGVAAAHQKGIIHRDLKPANIFLTRDGQVKVLDFGLAKLVLPEQAVDSPDTMVSPATVSGIVMGTMGYMSPEQVKGAATDARSDIFSFGTVLYEMLTGKRAFKRDTAAETMTAILRDEPPELAETGWHGPLGLQKILARCLEKDPERRFQSASDLGFAIEALSGSSTGIESQAHTALKMKTNWWPWVAAALGVVALTAAAWVAGKSSSARVETKFTRLTYQRGFATNARFTKDPGIVVYSAQWRNEPLTVYTVRTEFPQSVKVDLPSANLLAVSPGGDLQLGVNPTYHATFIDGTLAQAPIGGGTPRALQKSVLAADYGPDGKKLAVTRIANQKVQLEYPQGKVIYTTSGYVDSVRVSPSGKQVAFLDHPVYDDDRGWVALIDEAGNHKQLTREFATVQGLVWSRSGEELWFTAAIGGTNRALYAVTLSGKQRHILATPTALHLLDIAPDGRVLLSSEELRDEISGIDPATGKERTGLEWFNGSVMGDISSDGKDILYEEWGGPAGELYLVVHRKLDGSAPTALGDGSAPRLSPDGTTAAAVLLSRPPKVALHPIGTGESRQLALGDMITLIQVAWFPDAKHLLLNGAVERQGLRTYEVDLDGGKPQPVGPPDFWGSAVAKDGEHIAGNRATGEAVVFDTQTQNLQVIPGIAPQDSIDKWTDDGQAVLVTSSTPFGGEVNRVEVSTGKRTLLQKLELAERAGSCMNLRMRYAERSKTYVYQARRILSTLYVVEGLQ